MKDFLNGFKGKKIDVVCAGGVAVRGEVIEVDEVLHLKDDDKICYVVLDKITVVYETKDKKEQRTGFVGGFSSRNETLD